MCGIVGIVDLEGAREIDRDQLARMNAVQLHRGPDEGDVYIEPGVGLGHRRLAIIDLCRVSSRCSTRTAASSWSTTARSTTTPDW